MSQAHFAYLLFVPNETMMKWISWPPQPQMVDLLKYCEMEYWYGQWQNYICVPCCVNWLLKYVFILCMVCVLTPSFFLLCCLIHHISRPTVDVWVRLDLRSALYLHSSPVVYQGCHMGQHALSVFDFSCLPCVKPMTGSHELCAVSHPTLPATTLAK